MSCFFHPLLHLGVISPRNIPFVLVKGERVYIDSLSVAWEIMNIFVRHKHEQINGKTKLS